MAKTTILFSKPIKTLSVFIVTILLMGSATKAQKQADSTKKLLLAAAGRTNNNFIIREANAEFPELLRGNEAQTVSYIENFSDKRRDYLVRMYNKGKKLLPQAGAILKKYDLPEELRMLLVLESAYNGNAVSKAGAVGYWQFMDEVAKEYGLKYVSQLSVAEKRKLAKAKLKKGDKSNSRKKAVKLVDERKNFSVATHAAARYLRDRRRNLDDNWLLVVASYNCGVGNVWNAMAKTGKEDPSFWDIKKYLPSETQAYVMNFIALNVIFHNYSQFSCKTKLCFAPEKIIIKENADEITAETDGIKTGL